MQKVSVRVSDEVYVRVGGGGGGALSRLEAARSLGRVEVRNVAAALVRPHQLALAPARGLSGRGGVRSPREGAASEGAREGNWRHGTN